MVIKTVTIENSLLSAQYNGRLFRPLLTYITIDKMKYQVFIWHAMEYSKSPKAIKESSHHSAGG